MNCAVTRWQILTKDPEATARFYEGLFGWRFSDDNSLGYRQVATDPARGLDGGIWPAPSGAPETVQLYVEVTDIDDVLARLPALGGQVLMPKQSLPDGDTMALALDPLGRPFGLLAAKLPAQPAE